MAGSSIPAPLGSGGNQPGIDSGTLVLAPMPAPGATTGAPPPSAISPEATPVVAEATPVQVEDPAIEALDLASTARDAAYALKKAHAAVAFTSGRRSKADQARAMAGNVVLNRQWIEQTYAAGTLRTKCQKWVDENPTKTTQDEVAEGLLSVLDAATDAGSDATDASPSSERSFGARRERCASAVDARSGVRSSRESSAESVSAWRSPGVGPAPGWPSRSASSSTNSERPALPS